MCSASHNTVDTPKQQIIPDDADCSTPSPNTLQVTANRTAYHDRPLSIPSKLLALQAKLAPVPLRQVSQAQHIATK
jgi:hypothetical protein